MTFSTNSSRSAKQSSCASEARASRAKHGSFCNCTCTTVIVEARVETQCTLNPTCKTNSTQKLQRKLALEVQRLRKDKGMRKRERERELNKMTTATANQKSQRQHSIHPSLSLWHRVHIWIATSRQLLTTENI